MESAGFVNSPLSLGGAGGRTSLLHSYVGRAPRHVPSILSPAFSDSSGDERFSTAIEPWGDWGKNPPPGRWNFYSYWHEMKASGDGKYWGNSFAVPEAPVIARGQWICVEFMLQHNTPGQPDGEHAFWIDGKLLGHWKGINWRKTPGLKANALTLESYVTDRWTKNETNVVSFDNLVIARSYVGPSAEKN